MKYLFILMMFVSCATAQEVKIENDSLQFPEDFYGIYKGDLQMTTSKGNRTIGMEFHLNKTDSIGKYQYMLVYVVEGNRQERKYNLITKDASKGEYVVDENNGILLDAKLVDNTIYSMFEVNESIITTTERFYKNAMDFEITFTDKKQKVISGTEGEKPTEVISYPIGERQKAHLIKQ